MDKNGMKYFITISLTLIALGGLSQAQEIFVTIPPLKYFTERIVGDVTKVGVILAPGQNPHSYSPSAKEISIISRADLLLTAGVPFEENLFPRLKNLSKNLKVVDVSEGLPKRKFQLQEAPSHPDHDAHSHEEEAWDPHVWMSPRLAMKQSANILKAVTAWKPEKKKTFETNYTKWEKDLRELDGFLKETFRALDGSTFFAYHPAYGYFADAYGLKQVALEANGKQPSPADLRHLIERAKVDKVKVIFVQKHFSASSARVVANAIHGAVVTLDPLAEDYLENMRSLGKTVAENLR